jgi:hypothetical protein
MTTFMRKPTASKTTQFQLDLLESVRQMRAGQAARKTVVPLSAADPKSKEGRSKVKFKDLHGIARNAQSTENRDRTDRTFLNTP